MPTSTQTFDSPSHHASPFWMSCPLSVRRGRKSCSFGHEYMKTVLGESPFLFRNPTRLRGQRLRRRVDALHLGLVFTVEGSIIHPMEAPPCTSSFWTLRPIKAGLSLPLQTVLGAKPSDPPGTWSPHSKQPAFHIDAGNSL